MNQEIVRRDLLKETTENLPQNEVMPHIAVISANVVVHKQSPTGTIYPMAVKTLNFSATLEGDNEEDTIKEVEDKLKQIKSLWNSKALTQNEANSTKP